MDDQEARTVATEYLIANANSLLQLYDGVILPALTMAEQDRHKGALDPEREDFLFSNLREMLAEFSDQVRNSCPDGPKRPLLPGRILCVPAHDEADEIAASMLAQLLEHECCATVSFPYGSISQGTIDVVKPADNDVFCISAIPPYAFSHARTVNRQLRERFPRAKILIGVWGFSGDMKRALQRFQPSLPDTLVCRLTDALEFLGVPPQPTPAAESTSSAPAAL